MKSVLSFVFCATLQYSGTFDHPHPLAGDRAIVESFSVSAMAVLVGDLEIRIFYFL